MACRLDERQAVWLPSSPRRWPLKRTSYRSMSRIIINRSSFTLNRQQCRIWYLPIGYAGNTSVSIASPLARLSVPATSAALGIAFKWIWSSALICTNFHLAVRDSEQRPQYILYVGRKVRHQDYVYVQRVECEEPCEGETFTHGSVRGWGWNSLALLDPVPLENHLNNLSMQAKQIRQ